MLRVMAVLLGRDNADMYYKIHWLLLSLVPVRVELPCPNETQTKHSKGEGWKGPGGEGIA